MTAQNESGKLARVANHVRAAQILFYLIGGIWLVLSLFTMVRGNWILAVMMVGNGGVLVAVGLGLNKYRKLSFRLGIAVLAVNILLTFTDQFGYFDLATVLIDLGLFILLLINRKYYLG